MTALWLPLVLAALGAALTAAAGRRWPRAAAPLALLAAAGVAASLTAAVVGRASAVDLPWLPAWGWRLHLALDGLGAVYGLLAALVALPVLAYAASYMPHHLAERSAPRRRGAGFFAWMLLFAGAMVGLALAADLVLLLVFFDLTAVCSWALIGFDREDGEARRAALTAMLVTGITSVGFLLGVVLLGVQHGTLEIARLVDAAPAGPITAAAMWLVLLAALAKSAQVPLHFWLPRAMAAPTPVSAYLHSAAMVAAGVFVLHRLHPLLPGGALTALAAVGWASVVVGGALALVAAELKRILAYSTIAHYGHVAVILGLGGAKGAAAAAVYVLAHGVAKSALFLAAGAVTRATGSRRLDEAGGLVGREPLLAAATAVAAAALAGLPLTAGFFKDEGFFQVLEAHGPAAAAAGAAALALTTAYTWRFFAGAFLGRADRPRERAPRGLVLPVAVLAAALLAGGAAAPWLAEAGRGAAAAVHGAPGHFELAYHLDLRPTNRMALAGWLLGAALAASRRRWASTLSRLTAAAARRGPARSWDGLLRGLNALSDWLHVVEIRDLRDRVAAVLAPAGVLVAAALLAGRAGVRFASGGVPDDLPLALALLGAAGAAVAVLVVTSHLGMVLMLSSVGFVLAGVFALLGAPDVSLVAVLVETALTLLFVVALAVLPERELEREERRERPRHRSPWHTAAAVLAAGLAFAVAWAGLSNPASASIAARHVELAEHAHAKNVVAAILADFRALDTLGEVSVVVVALLGLATLLRRGRSP